MFLDCVPNEYSKGLVLEINIKLQPNYNYMKAKYLFAFLIIPLFIACEEEDKTGDKESPTKFVPNVETADITDVQQIVADCGGDVISDSGFVVTAKGICWSTSKVPTIEDNKTVNGEGAGGFSSVVYGYPDSTYYVRAYATNENGTSYGSTMKVTLKPYGSVTDIENNEYKTLILGGKEWMAENLRTTHYNNGEAITKSLISDTRWGSDSRDTTGAYCNHEDDTLFGHTYGRIYNYYVITDERGICPSGWHIATVDDVQKLNSAIGSEVLDKVGFFKSCGVLTGSLNYDYFDAWTSIEHDYNSAYNYMNSLALSPNWKEYGFAIRCVKD